MKRAVISDTSCLIVLSKIGHLDILQNLFGEVLISEEVRNEFGETLPDWIIVKQVKSQQIEKILLLNVDEGEASAMALYLEQTDDALLIIDERKGRIIAKDLGIKIIGTIGIILKAKEQEIIKDLSEIIELLEQTDFRLSPKLKQQLLSTKKTNKLNGINLTYDKIRDMEVTLNLPENIYRNFTRLAEKKQQRIEDVIADKLQDDFSAEMIDFEEAVATWSDEDVLALAKLKLPKEQADRMSELSDLQQRGVINNVEKSEMEMYLETYNNASLRKAYGIVEAVKRGLLTSPDELQ